jgi:hypothetical protein
MRIYAFNFIMLFELQANRVAKLQPASAAAPPRTPSAAATACTAVLKVRPATSQLQLASGLK